MESFFHGNSSGFDPLICYLRQPVLIKKDRNLEILKPLKSPSPIFLIDTGISRKAENLIKILSDKSQSEHYKNLITHDLVPNIDDAIAAFLNNQSTILLDIVHKISFFQYRFFAEAIPLPYKNIWLDGLSSDVYKLKLCGAGGGGFILGMCENVETTRQILLKSGVKMIPLSI